MEDHFGFQRGPDEGWDLDVPVCGNVKSMIAPAPHQDSYFQTFRV
jgi:hypothetical protein